MLTTWAFAARPVRPCSTGSLDPSHVLMAIGLPHEIAHGSLRLTLGEQNTEEDVDYIIETVAQVVSTLRSMSPVWENGKPNLTAASELHELTKIDSTEKGDFFYAIQRKGTRPLHPSPQRGRD